MFRLCTLCCVGIALFVAEAAVACETTTTVTRTTYNTVPVQRVGLFARLRANRMARQNVRAINSDCPCGCGGNCGGTCGCPNCTCTKAKTTVSSTKTTKAANAMECNCEVVCPKCGTKFRCTCPCTDGTSTACNCECKCPKCGATVQCHCVCATATAPVENKAPDEKPLTSEKK